jgi:hypothetical protein
MTAEQPGNSVGQTVTVAPARPEPRLVSSVPPLPVEWRPRAEPRTWKYIVLHHSATDRGDVQSIDIDHRARTDRNGEPWLGIGYHFVIGNGQGMADGEVAPTFRWQDQLAGAHAGKTLYNERGIGICLIGDFREQPPTPKQLDAARRLLAALMEHYRIAPQDCVRHGDITGTECPGAQLPSHELVAAAAAATWHRASTAGK